MSVSGGCRTKIKKLSHCDIRVIFHNNKLQRAISAKVRRTVIMSCLRVVWFFFLLTGVRVLSRLFLPPRGPWSAHKHHCLQGLLTASQNSLWSTGSTLTALPRRPIHPHRLGGTHTLSVCQRHSLWHSMGSYGFSDELDQIPTSHLVTHLFYAAIQHHLCFIDSKYHLTVMDIFHL